MNSVEFSHSHRLDHNEECVEETSSDHLLSSSSLDIYDIYGDTSVPPRLGDQYQAEIPSLLSESERLQFQHCPTNSGDMLGSSLSIGVGLPIPITSVLHVDGLIKHTQQEFLGTSVSADTDVSMDSMNNKESQFDSICCSVTGHPISHDTLPVRPNCEVEFSNGRLENCHEFARTTSKEHSTLDDPMDIELSCMQLKKASDCIPFIDSPIVSWSDYEIQSFVLGLYIFGKNLVQVRKFVGSKKMCDILSYYYGGFYKSDAYRRWAELRKMRGKRCIDGQRIFTGPRQQKLLSRMLPSLPKEVQDNLLEAAKSFREGVSSLEQFVFTLKAMVGMKLFVEAVGIGKGKHDLTGLGPTKSKKVIPMHPEIPVGKGYSSLTSGDIVKFLTGGFRLSKAKSNDLFWEAVWPRLLARGWHSEQPKYLSSVGSRNAIVFLIPGINKFSKKKHTKGDHYFDSVSDVLKKLASDPMLLELHYEGAKVSNSYNNKCKWDADADAILDQNGPSDQQSHCYLRPGLPNYNSQLVKFTIVDTSLFQGEGPFKVRELQSLPVDASRSYRPSNGPVDTDINSFKELTGSDVSRNDQEKSVSDISNHNKFGNSEKCNIDKGMQYEPSSHLVPVSKRKLAIDTKDDGVLNNKQLIKAVKCKHSRGLKSDKSTYLSPMLKKKRLTGCKYAGGHSASSSKGYQLNKEDDHLKHTSMELNEIMDREKSTSSSVKGSPYESSECNSQVYLTGSSDISAAVLSQEKHPPNTMIDLKIPEFPVDFYTGESVCSNMAGSQDGFNPKEPALKSKTNQQSDAPQHSDASNVVPSTQHPINNGWRQSTRNRPPTTRALEAFACGFLSTKRKGKGPKTLHQMS